MKVDTGIRTETTADTVEAVRAAQEAGYDGLWAAETRGDPFLPLVIAAEHSRTVELGTSIAVAFARTPMMMAYTAHGLQRLAEGRFILGLGSQVRAHIERRFCMPWSHPARRMREYVLALRAIWDAWQDGTPLNFEGDFYRHTLMTPFFTPAPMPFGPPKVFLAAVGKRMTEVAGEVGDGLLVHPFTTGRYLDEQLLPALSVGIERAGRTHSEVQLSLPCFIATGTDEQIMKGRERIRERVAFYGSTPAYHGVLAVHGWEDLGAALHVESRAKDNGRWARMARLVSDEVVDAFAISGPPDRIGTLLSGRFAGRLDRVSLTKPPEIDDQVWCEVITSVRATDHPTAT